MAIDLASVISATIVIILIYSAIRIRKARRLPPGPWGLPIIGSIPFLENHIGRAFHKLSQNYASDIISVNLGPKPVVCLNSYDVIKEALSSNSFTDRPDWLFPLKYFTPGKLGITESDGPIWKEQRRFTLSLLKDFGAGNQDIEERMSENIGHLVSTINKKHGQKFDPQFLLDTSTANVIRSILFGHSYPYDDPELQEFLENVKGTTEMLPPENPFPLFPWLRHLPGNWFNIKKILDRQAKTIGFTARLVEDHKQQFDPGDINDLTNAFLAEQFRLAEKHPHVYTDNRLQGVLNDMFIAGFLTTSALLNCGVFYLITYPEIQAKVQEEIDNVIGQARTPSLSDRRAMPYTNATLHEIERFSTILPVLLPHSNNTNDVMLRGYTIPKGTPVLANIWAVHRDPTVWKSPERFDPQNFLNDQGDFVNMKELMTFSVGRRQCPGEYLGKGEVFLTMVTLLQQFQFTTPEGAPPPSLEPRCRFHYIPQIYEICARKR